MALYRMADRQTADSDITVEDRDHFAQPYYEPNTGRSNFTAFLLGSGVVAASMLAFLYFDDGPRDRYHDLTTSSITRTAPPPALNEPKAETP